MSLPQAILTQKIDLPTYFNSFDLDHLAGKKTLKSLAELKSDLVKTNQHVAPKRREVLQTFVWKKASSCPPPYKSLYKISGLCHG